MDMGDHEGAHRPAVIVNTWGENEGEHVNMLVFLDPLNDRVDGPMAHSYLAMKDHYTVRHDETEKLPGTWHWPERV
jgi:hypothetical protein